MLREIRAKHEAWHGSPIARFSGENQLAMHEHSFTFYVDVIRQRTGRVFDQTSAFK